MTKTTPMLPMPVDPFVTAGPLLVTTESGARHLFVPGGAGTVTVARLAPLDPDGHTATWHGLRRDGEPLHLQQVTHLQDGQILTGILEGVEMCLALAPLRPDAIITMRLSTRVISVQQLPVAAVTELVEPDASELIGSDTDTTKPRPTQSGDAATIDSESEPPQSPSRALAADGADGSNLRTDDGCPSEPEPDAVSGNAAVADVFQERMLTAGEIWLVWCAIHGIDPLNTTVEQIHLAALDLRADGGSELDVLDLVDQVGFMTGLWRTPEWINLRRTI